MKELAAIWNWVGTYSLSTSTRAAVFSFSRLADMRGGFHPWPPPACKWKRDGPGEWVAICDRGIEGRIVDSTFATTITTPWRHPFFLPDRATPTEAMTGFEEWVESARIIVEPSGRHHG